MSALVDDYLNSSLQPRRQASLELLSQVKRRQSTDKQTTLFCCCCFCFENRCIFSIYPGPQFVFFLYCLCYKPLTTSSFPVLAASGFILKLPDHLFSAQAPVLSTVNQTGTCCLLAGPTPIAETGKAPEAPQPSKTLLLAWTFEPSRELCDSSLKCDQTVKHSRHPFSPKLNSKSTRN